MQIINKILNEIQLNIKLKNFKFLNLNELGFNSKF